MKILSIIQKKLQGMWIISGYLFCTLLFDGVVCCEENRARYLCEYRWKQEMIHAFQQGHYESGFHELQPDDRFNPDDPMFYPRGFYVNLGSSQLVFSLQASERVLIDTYQAINRHDERDFAVLHELEVQIQEAATLLLVRAEAYLNNRLDYLSAYLDVNPPVLK